MRKTFLCLIVFLLISPFVFADRDVSTIKAYNSSQLIKTGDAKVYSVTFIASNSNGDFILFDALLMPTSTTTMTTVKAEGGEATSGNSHFQDFSNNPLEFSTGLYLFIKDGTALIRHEIDY